MSQYKIEFDHRIKKDLRSINSQEINRIKQAIAKLAENPLPSGCKKLKGKNNDYTALGHNLSVSGLKRLYNS